MSCSRTNIQTANPEKMRGIEGRAKKNARLLSTSTFELVRHFSLRPVSQCIRIPYVIKES